MSRNTRISRNILVWLNTTKYISYYWLNTVITTKYISYYNKELLFLDTQNSGITGYIPVGCLNTSIARSKLSFDFQWRKITRILGTGGFLIDRIENFNP